MVQLSFVLSIVTLISLLGFHFLTVTVVIMSCVDPETEQADRPQTASAGQKLGHKRSVRR